MNGRERLSAVLCKQPTDRMAWTALVTQHSLDLLPESLRRDAGIGFYRYLGCDIFLLNGHNTPYKFRSPQLQWGHDVTTEERWEGRRYFVTWHTRDSDLTSIRDRGHPVKFPVDSIEAVRSYRAMWENASYICHDDDDVLASLDAILGDDGVVTRFWGPSTIPRLLEIDMGTQNFYYLLADYPDEMEALINTMHERQLEAFRCLARGPWQSATLIENTSTYYISPRIYARYNMPHQRDFVEAMKATGKAAILHMCGHVRDLLPLIRETGCDGIHALTPPPTGNTPWEEALDAIGEDLIIIGCLDPTIWISGPLDEIGPALDRLITPRLREANFVLGPFADGIPVPLARFKAVKTWMEANTQA
jgi:hypothetical protein